MIYYCEKCNSEEVEIENITPVPPEERKSIADFNGYGCVSTAIYRPQTYRIRCKNCGNKKEVTN